MWIRATSFAAVVVAAGAAQGAFFSFASGSASSAWTFQGNGLNFTDGTGPNDPITLFIDDNNGPLPTLGVSTQFNSNVALAYSGSVNLGGGNFSHNYTAQGSYSFTDILSGVTLLTVNFNNALFTAQGAALSWYPTAALQASGPGVSM